MEAKHIQLVAAGPDEKVWIAEITDEDETFKLKRDFLPEQESGIWDIYPGWYQIQGLVPGRSEVRQSRTWRNDAFSEFPLDVTGAT